MTEYQKRKILLKFAEGDKVRVTTNKTVDEKSIDQNEVYIYIGYNHDYDALLIKQNVDKYDFKARLKVRPDFLVKIKD